ncbi:hypothetical protein [Mesobacillus harenae]|uniref:hypothetical protein n=1 Tax=Mesobacillus harenae TaxID=2213203 RepID=UPI0015806676|nr:hypothetical protein [Mesobacillus harenae]
MKKISFILFLNILLLLGTFNAALAGKPQGASPSLQVSSLNSYESITLDYHVLDARKTPDEFLVKRGGVVLYKGRNQNFVDSRLSPETKYTYTVEAYSRGKLLASSSYTASTLQIIEARISVNGVAQSGSIAVTWEDSREDLLPTEYRVYVDGVLKATVSSQKITEITNLKPGTYTVAIEGWYTNYLVSKGSQSVVVPEPIPVSPIEVQNTLNSDFSVDLSYQVVNPALPADRYVVSLGEKVVFDGIPSSSTTIKYLNPGQSYTAKVEVFSENILVGEGTTSFTAPHKIETYYDFYDFDIKQAYLIFTYDQSLQNADQIVITRRDEIIFNGYPQETTESITVYNGEPIEELVTDTFVPEVTRYNYQVLNYQNGVLVGVGYASVPNVFYY